MLVLANWRTPGLAGARNTGILALDTELVAFCDDDDTWAPDKLRRQVDARRAAPRRGVRDLRDRAWRTRAPRCPRLAGTDVGDAAPTWPAPGWRCCTRRRFLVRRDALPGPPRAWSPRTRRAARTRTGTCCCGRPAGRPIVHVDEPLVRVLWGRSSHFSREYETKISSLRWMMERHPEIAGDRPGAARVYGQLAFGSAALGRALPRPRGGPGGRCAVGSASRAPTSRSRWPVGVVKAESVMSYLHRRGRGL